MNKPFFFRIDVGDLLNFATDPEGENMTVLQFAKELQRGESEIEYIQQIIDEAIGFSEKKKNSGKLGGLAKASTAKAKRSTALAKASTALAKASTPLASSSNSSSNSNSAKKEHKPMSEKSDSYSSEFSQFWKQYPRKTGKGKAFETWKKIKGYDYLDEILNSLIWQCESDQWKNGFIPLPTTYLNQRRWDDEPEEPIIEKKPITFEQQKINNTKRAMMDFIGEDYGQQGQEGICVVNREDVLLLPHGNDKGDG